MTVGGLSIYDLSRRAIRQAIQFIAQLSADGNRCRLVGARARSSPRRSSKSCWRGCASWRTWACTISPWIAARRSLSGGEAQRIRLATQIGSQLMGVLYILDEPSIGLHQRDNQRLIETLMRLRDLGNTVLVVEHDEETIRAADYVIDLGPGAGEHGGQVVCQGTVPEILACPESLTGRYLSGDAAVPVPAQRRSGNGKALTIVRRAREQPEEHRRAHPAGQLCGHHRRVRLGQEQPADGDPLQAAGPGAEPRHRAPRRARRASMASSTWTR